MTHTTQLPAMPRPKFTAMIRGVPCITVTEHEHLMRAYALQANAILALSVPDDVVRDAKRYRWLRENGKLGFSGAPSWRASVSFDAVDAYAQTLDSNIDAARSQEGA